MNALAFLGATVTLAFGATATATLIVEDFTGGFDPAFNHFMHDDDDATQAGNWMLTDLGGEDCLSLFQTTAEITYCLEPEQTVGWASVRLIDYCGIGCSTVEFIGTLDSHTFGATVVGAWETFTTDGLGLGDILQIRLTSDEGAFDDISIDVEGSGGTGAAGGRLIVDDFTGGFDPAFNHFLHDDDDATLSGNWMLTDLEGEDGLGLFQTTDEVTYCLDPGETAVWASVRLIDYCGIGCTQVEFIGSLDSHTFGATVVGEWETFTTDGLGLGEILAISLTSSEGFFDDVSVEIEGSVPGDATGDGDVDFEDLLLVLASWGPCVGCPADLDGDGEVGFTDLLEVLSGWSV